MLYHTCWPLLTPLPSVETLAPLTAASDLPNHPALSAPYNSSYLDEMIAKISETLRREQQNLAKMKKLLTTLRGDADFAPCGVMETDYDALLAKGQGLGPVGASLMSAASSVADLQSLAYGSVAPEATTNGEAAGSRARTNGAGVTASDTAVSDAASAVLNGAPSAIVDGDGATLSTSTTREDNTGGPVQAIPTTELDSKVKSSADADILMANGQLAETTEEPPAGDGEEEDPDSQPISHRMTTRAQANKTSGEMSVDDASVADSVPPVHPYFMFPASATGDAQAGLPLKEAEEARGYLAHYVSKREEVVLNLQQLEAGLLEAQRKRKLVMKWCKAEGHVGEMSDGEDWYDIDEWGLDAPLRKGDEEVEEDVGISGKKTRRRGERAAN